MKVLITLNENVYKEYIHKIDQKPHIYINNIDIGEGYLSFRNIIKSCKLSITSKKNDKYSFTYNKNTFNKKDNLKLLNIN
ncbi:hypothetical protein crov017 [Cafeteria roenbergensis virus]|uniref:Uncharacterized protein n=1 Tax=Cafeteria roenbergensis virus (strain BV-PW1) TaxID=693272 RepID=E3T4D7_CROVB|nr:hypothetical protein crov017 [Cafeteria roenbergensis virus BV-PW1]ADO67050.1 hypothetical protein crov017 [Cafeteria roenbergensis virus BV-PW1]